MPETCGIVLPSMWTKPDFPSDLRLGYEILISSAIAYYSDERSGAHLFWSTAGRARSASRADYAPGFTACIPSRYNKNDCLDASLNCVLSTIEEVFRYGKTYDRRKCNISYVNALAQLRKAIEGENHAEVQMENITTSILLLAIYESLLGASTFSWSTHISGLARIYAMTGPTRVVTELEKSVLHAGMGGFIAEFYMSNTACFLDEPNWQSFLHTFLEDKDSITLFIRPARTFLAGLCRAPGLLTCCRAIVNNPAHQADIQGTIQQAIELRTELMGLIPGDLLVFNHRLPPGYWADFSKEERRVGEYCSLVVTITLLSRIIIALTGGTIEMEQEAHNMACVVIDIHEQALRFSDPYTSADVKYRTTRLRLALVVVKMHGIFLQHCLTWTVALGTSPHIMDEADFVEFHERVRGNIQM